MLYGATIVLGLFAAEFTLELTSSILSETIISMFQNYAWQPPIDDAGLLTPSEMLASLEIAE